MTMQGLIEAQPVGTVVERIVTLSVVAIFAVHLFVPEAPNVLLFAGFLLFVLVALCIPATQGVHVSLFCFLWVFLPILISSLARWPLNKVAPLLMYGCLVALVPILRRSIHWMQVGRFGADIRLLVLLLVVSSAAALAGWNIMCKPDLAPSRANIPEMPLWLMPLAGIAFSLINAAVEEAIFRGIFLQALDTSIGPGIISLAIQAVLFGWMHYSEVGFPRGLLGVAMASVYGLILGHVRYRARGMLAVWLAHTGTDIAVFTIVATS